MEKEEVNKIYAKAIKREKLLISFINITMMVLGVTFLVFILNLIAKIG